MEKQQEIDQLVRQIEQWNIEYRTGESEVSDDVYDDACDRLKELDETNKVLTKIGFIHPTDRRKKKLPIQMASMNKVKLFEEILTWVRLKKIPEDTLFVITPKLDGMSLCIDENDNGKKAWTRGDGECGQFVPNHYAASNGFKEVYSKKINDKIFYSFGEFILSRKTFVGKYSNYINERTLKPFKNPRNLIAGKVRDENISEILSDCDYIRYGMADSNGNEANIDKIEQLELLNECNYSKIKYKTAKLKDLSEDYLNNLFHEWNTEYELDGLIIEVNDAKLRQQLGRETNTNNPCYARAYKGNFEEIKDTEVVGLEFIISKIGYLKPVISIFPIELNGATVSNCFVDNARFVNGFHLHVGSKVKIKRSGMVIPRIVEIDGNLVEKDKNNKVIYPYKDSYLKLGKCTHCGSDTEWNESGVEIVCSNFDCPGRQLQRIIAFFEILQCEEVADGICESFYDNGYKTIASILELKPEQMIHWEGWGEKSAYEVYNAIHSKLVDVPIERIQHASGCFVGLGSKKLALVKHFKQKPSIEALIKIDGYSDISAKAYLNGIDKFNSFLAGLSGVTVKYEDDIVEQTGQKCKNWAVVFTGFRDEKLEKLIISNGGQIKSGVSKASTHLIMNEKGSGSSKEAKATAMGMTIMDKGELEKYLN